MKKIILLVCSLSIIHVAKSQQMQAQPIQFSLEGGINFSGAYAVEDGEVIKGGPLPGFQIGVSATKIITPKISFQPALLFVYGSTYRKGIDVSHTKYHVFLIKVPLMVVYQRNDQFFFGAGPFIGYALSGKYNFRGQSYKITWGGNVEEDDSKRLDAGLDFMAGYILNPEFSLKAAFGLGLINPANAPLRVNTRILEIMIAYSLKYHPFSK